VDVLKAMEMRAYINTFWNKHREVFPSRRDLPASVKRCNLGHEIENNIINEEKEEM
jgi:hypothetical protein